MRKTVLWQSPHVRVSLSALLALIAIVFVVGCGGGGGGGNGGATNGGNNNGGNNGNTPPPGQNPQLPFLSGRITDTSVPAGGIAGANITLFGTGVPNIQHTTSSDGTFTIANVDPRYTSFAVLSPDTGRWYNFALYNSKQYDTLNCRMPLPVLVAGSNNLLTTVALFNAGNNPPPPPPINGCP